MQANLKISPFGKPGLRDLIRLRVPQIYCIEIVWILGEIIAHERFRCCPS